MSTPTILDEALRHAAEGFEVFPLAAFKGDGSKSDGKKPAVKWKAEASKDPEQLRKWFGHRGRYARGGLALRTGATRTNPDTGATEWLVVVDVDMASHGKDGLSALKAACAAKGLRLEDFPTRVQQTAGGGWHALYWSPVQLKDGTDVFGAGSGVDMKADAYIVVAPTRIGDRPYTWDDPAASIATMGGLTSLFTAGAPRTATADRTRLLGVDPERALQRGIDYLATAPRSVKGAGGDQCAYTVAAQLLALGLDESAALELLLSEHWEHGCGWSADRLAEKVRNAASYMQSRPGADAPEAAFEPVPEAKPASHYNLLSVGELLNRAPPSWLVRGLLPRRGLGVVYGAPGSGKSFLVLDLAAAIARGIPWAGQRVKRGAVVYVGLEGQMGPRVSAYLREHQLAPADVATLQVIERQGLNLLQGERADVRRLIADIQAADVGPVAMVVVDTLNRAMPGGNENDSADMGRAIRCAGDISAALNCLCVFVHHSGKDTSKGMRGHSSLLGAADAELEVRRDNGDARYLEATKVKDGEDGARFAFRLKVIDLGATKDHDPDADPFERDTSCIVEGLERAAIGPSGKARNWTPHRTNAMDALRSAFDRGARFGAEGLSDEGLCSIDDWRAAYHELVPIGETLDGAELRQATNTRGRNFANAVDWLTAEKLVSVHKKKGRSGYRVVS